MVSAIAEGWIDSAVFTAGWFECAKPTKEPSASMRVLRMLADTFCRCVPMMSTMSSEAKRHGRWKSVTLKLSCSFFSSDESSTIDVVVSTAR